MSLILYNIFLWLFRAGTHVAALFNPKAKKWVQGRKGIFSQLEEAIPADAKTIWMHCASLGEFEQGRPVIEQLRVHYPDYKVLLTFFSPSGYEVQKNYDGADWVFYLPLDGPRSAKRFLEIVHPSLVIFVKYEFWFYYLKKIKYRNIPLLLISALFRKDMSFFKWYGKLQRKMLSRFDHLFVQTLSSKQLLDKIGLAAITTVSGDTRFDRVAAIAAQPKAIPGIVKFIGDSQSLIAGSTWPDDETILQQAMADINESSLKLIIAPHEINEKHINDLLQLFPGATLYSSLNPNEEPQTNCLIIDNIGMLSSLYQYCDIAYIGGGFRKSGVHNVLEAAVYGKPVIYGPQHSKYSEAVGLVKSGGGISVRDKNELKQVVDELLANAEKYQQLAKASYQFVNENKGATGKIIGFIQEKRLLTS